MYQVWWKSIDVYSSYHPETKNGRDGRWTDVQRETIIPCHYCVAGYNDRINKILLCYDRKEKKKKLDKKKRTVH